MKTNFSPSSSASFNRLWEESKKEHQKDVSDRSMRFRKTFKKWSRLMTLLNVVWFKLFKRIYDRRLPVYRQVARIVDFYIPQIKVKLGEKQYWFDRWEAENAGPDLSASEYTCVQCDRIAVEVRSLCSEFMDEIGVVRGYDKWFYPIENPLKLVENPYPGFLDVSRAQNYCNKLLCEFPRKK